MNLISRQRCFNHVHREAVAVCLECDRYFCRECITEHYGKMICAPCLSLVTVQDGRISSGGSLLPGSLLFLGAVFLLWSSFYALGQLLLTLPASFHEGTLWKDLWPPGM